MQVKSQLIFKEEQKTVSIAQTGQRILVEAVFLGSVAFSETEITTDVQFCHTPLEQSLPPTACLSSQGGTYECVVPTQAL